MVNKVLPGLYITNAHLAASPDLLIAEGITSVVKLYESPPDWQGDFRLLDSPIPDGEPLAAHELDTFVEHIRIEREAGQTVAVCCGAGISRSATIILAYLCRFEDMNLEQAYKHLIARHPIADPHPALWQSLLDYLGAPYTGMDLLAWRIEQ
jgi:hypothetical protein